MVDSTRRAFLKASAFAAVGSQVKAASGNVSAAATIVPAAAPPLRFGANYIPRKNWLYSWLDWDIQSVQEDLNTLAALGMDHIRMHCLWPLFQPGINTVSQKMLDQTSQLLDAADRAGLDVEVTVLTGWMSGSAFMPAWTVPNAGPNDNVFTSRAIIDAEKLLFSRLARQIGGHKRFLGFDLGNEISVVCQRGNPATGDQTDAWCKQLFDYLESIAPGKLHVNGLPAPVWTNTFNFTPQAAATLGGATCTHVYPYFTGAIARYGYSGVGSLHIGEFMVEYAYAHQTDLARRVWMEETGISAAWMPENYMPEWADKFTRAIAETGKLWGVTWWCSHDIDSKLLGFKPAEYSFGLLDQQNQPKPIGKAVAALARALRKEHFSATAKSVALVVPDHGLAPPPGADWAFATPFMKLISEGKRPCIVLKGRARDEDYLRARGITELIEVPLPLKNDQQQLPPVERRS